MKLLNKHFLAIIALFFLGSLGLLFQNSFIKTNYYGLKEIQLLNNLVAGIGDVPEDYEATGAGTVFCQDPGEDHIVIPRVTVKATFKGENVPNVGDINASVTFQTDNQGTFTLGDISDAVNAQIDIASTTIVSALKLGWITVDFAIVSLPDQNYLNSIGITNAPTQTNPFAMNCADGAHGACVNGNVCNSNQTAYVNCSMAGLEDEELLQHSGQFLFRYTNCSQPSPTPSPSLYANCGQWCDQWECQPGQNLLCIPTSTGRPFCTKPEYQNACQDNPAYVYCCTSRIPPTEEEPRCDNLSLSKANPKPGDSVTLTCFGAGGEEEDEFLVNFRLLNNSGAEIIRENEVEVDDSDHASYTFSLPASLTAGNYKTQCQICSEEGEGNCTAWGQAYPESHGGENPLTCEAGFAIISPSPSPSSSPSPSPSPSPLQCKALRSDLDPEPGTSLSLICSGSGIASDNPADYRAEFKLTSSPDGTAEYSFSEDLGQVDLDIDSAQAQTSYSVPSDLEDGYYHIECRICDKATGETCTQWGQVY